MIKGNNFQYLFREYMSKTLSYFKTQSEEEAVNNLLADLDWNEALAKDAHEYAVDLIQRIRKTRRKAGSLESFFQQYGLNTTEGLALMSMAEALLRIPDPKTASALIRDKVAGTNWLKNASSSDKDWMTKVAGLGLKLTSGTMNSLFSKLGEPVIREAMARAMKMLGKQFVVGETLSGAIKSAKPWEEKGFRFSYDMLGEGARTARDAQHYFDAYAGALHDLAGSVDKKSKNVAPGISVKLSALHPRYEFAQNDRCLPELTERLIALCEIAAESNLGLTIDAEEVARLDPSLRLIENICLQSQFDGWDGFGLAVQAYQKSAPAVLDQVISLAHTYGRKLQVRLVKGAYWDTEVKHAQVEGFADYPVYTRKSNTDVSYLLCAQKMLKNMDALYPMFGTHNAHTVAAIVKMAGNNLSGFEFQKLYGMGDALYNQIIEDQKLCVCVYAPVGPYSDLLPYLVRRMLENGANSSFVNQIYKKDIEPSNIADDPVVRARTNESKHHPKIPLPQNIYGEARKNSHGIDLDDRAVTQNLLNNIAQDFKSKNYEATSLIAGKNISGGPDYQKINPANKDDVVGRVYDLTLDNVQKVFETAKIGQIIWQQTDAHHRADILENIANALEENSIELISLCVREGGRTIQDAHHEIREAVDFCRYYAAQGRHDFNEIGRTLVSPTGESNIYTLGARGIFVCISPWNFPIAIYTGQIAANLMAGNAVVAKPAEQTSLTGHFIAKLMHQAGVPAEVLTLVVGDGRIGAALTEHNDVAGVAFTGSTAVAQSINRTLANKDGAIAKLIAETGGQNAMIVDSSALTEQVIDDLVQSAFGSSGQRCSACRVLYIQEDVADKTITMLQGAMKEIRLGDPANLSSDIGPLIDEEAFKKVQQHKTRLSGFGRKIAETPLDKNLSTTGHFFAPIAYEINELRDLSEEIFGPVLHVIRFKSDEIDRVVDDINESGYGLTFGVHSRIESFIKKLTGRVSCGNVYVNRGTIGAVVGVQPFGGRGLSGTGPKAGGPLYLHAFATEKVVSTDTTAAGGNASLVMISE
jgi:RHH-type proline utilization regulon transcriptional repressor/proline dehydrogenase/delta 1-pyrroline-5-carboxylate dehydrogenase